MRDGGGHGGSSYSEVNVPLIFLGPSCAQTNDSYNQIDMPATLAVLFGLPIPASSIGVMIPNLLTGLSREQKLFAYYYNGKRLLQKLIEIDDGHEKKGKDNIWISTILKASNEKCHLLHTEFSSQFTEAKNMHKIFLQMNTIENENERKKAFKLAERNYIGASKAMSDELADSYVNFDHICIVIGLICLVTVFNFSTVVSYHTRRKYMYVFFFFRHFFMWHCHSYRTLTKSSSHRKAP